MDQNQSDEEDYNQSAKNINMIGLESPKVKHKTYDGSSQGDSRANESRPDIGIQITYQSAIDKKESDYDAMVSMMQESIGESLDLKKERQGFAVAHLANMKSLSRK